MNNPPDIEQLIRSIVDGVPLDQLAAQCTGLDLNGVGVWNRTPLMVSSAEGLLAVVELLVRNGASVHATGLSQMTALHEAAANNHVSVAKYLLSHGAEIDVKTIDGCTPLMCAATWGNMEVAKFLLANGADRTKTDLRGGTAADSACEKGEETTADMIDSYPELGENKL